MAQPAHLRIMSLEAYDVTSTNILLLVVNGLLAVLYGGSMYWMNVYRRKVDNSITKDQFVELEKKLTELTKTIGDHMQNTIPRDEFQRLEVRLEGLISRQELISYMKQTSDNQDVKHAENVRNFEQLRKDVHQDNSDTRLDLRNIHLRIDTLVQRGQS